MKGLFEIGWQSDGLATLRSLSNGRYVTARLNGSLQATVDQSGLGDRERFTLTLANRPRLFLKCEHGFVGVKASASPVRAECNRALSEPVTLVPVRHWLKDDSAGHANTAAYHLKGKTKTSPLLSSRACLSHRFICNVYLISTVSENLSHCIFLALKVKNYTLTVFKVIDSAFRRFQYVTVSQCYNLKFVAHRVH